MIWLFGGLAAFGYIMVKTTDYLIDSITQAEQMSNERRQEELRAEAIRLAKI